MPCAKERRQSFIPAQPKSRGIQEQALACLDATLGLLCCARAVPTWCELPARNGTAKSLAFLIAEACAARALAREAGCCPQVKPALQAVRMVLEAAQKPRSRVQLVLQALGLALLALALLVLPSRAFAGQLVERLDVFATLDRKNALQPLRSWRQAPPPSLERAQTAALPPHPQLVQPPPTPRARNVSCQLDLRHTPFERSCTRLEDACVDQVRGRQTLGLLGSSDGHPPA